MRRGEGEGCGDFTLNNTKSLFSRVKLSDVLRWQEQDALKTIIESFDANRLLSTSVQDLIEYFVNKLQIVPIYISVDQVYVDQTEIKIDVSQDQRRTIADRSKPYDVNGTRIIYFVPYQGDENLLYSCPSHSSTSRPRAKVTSTELQFIFDILDHNVEEVKSTFERQLRDLNQYLEWSEQEINYFNSQLPQKIQKTVEARRQKLLKDQGIVASLGYPLKKRHDAPTTFAAPIVRKKITIPQPATTEPYTPEPELNMDQYEQVLSVISNMVLVMERSPKAFKTMGEEDLRQHFLVQLNGQYEGQATGETFNYEGKTDILIRTEGKNLFIAECKFWRGPKSLTDTIDQLLGYASWRDTKTAILVFNRAKNFSRVIEKIPELVKNHPNFKRKTSCIGETNTRFVFHNKDDTNRELILTVMAFDVPGDD